MFEIPPRLAKVCDATGSKDTHRRANFLKNPKLRYGHYLEAYLTNIVVFKNTFRAICFDILALEDFVGVFHFGSDLRDEEKTKKSIAYN
jgi:hypothetical protein